MFEPRYTVLVSPVPVLAGSIASGVFQPSRPLSPEVAELNEVPPLVERRSAPNCDSA